jgi:hypothetical protein
MGLGPQVTPSSAENKNEESKGNSFLAAGFKASSLSAKEYIPKG